MGCVYLMRCTLITPLLQRWSATTLRSAPARRAIRTRAKTAPFRAPRWTLKSFIPSYTPNHLAAFAAAQTCVQTCMNACTINNRHQRARALFMCVFIFISNTRVALLEWRMPGFVLGVRCVGKSYPHHHHPPTSPTIRAAPPRQPPVPPSRFP